MVDKVLNYDSHKKSSDNHDDGRKVKVEDNEAMA